MPITVSSTEFQQRVGEFFEAALTEPVYVSKHKRSPSIAVVNRAEYEALVAFRAAHDTREAYYTHELPDDIQAELEKGFQGAPTPHLDDLMD